MPPKRQTPGVSPVPGISSGINENIEFHSAEEFTRSVKRKLSSSTRTGQACDRCKIRKIRCDGLPGGCSPCMQNRTECRTTDRISQRAMPRGYVENLEAKVVSLEARVKELEATLALERSARGDHAGSPGMINGGQKHEASNLRNGIDSYNSVNGNKSTTYSNGNRNIKISPQQQHRNKFPVDDKIRCFRAGGYYLGLSSGAATLHTMRDSALSVLGVEIDLSDVDPTDTKNPGVEDGIGESYASCLSSMFNTNPKAPQNLGLPSQADCMECAQWFFSFSYSYLPIVHRPTFLKQLERIYDDRDYQPSAGVIVQVHMMVAICYWQTGTRGRLKDTADSLKLKKSYEHYHFALTHFYLLLHSASLEDLQALCLILQHIRSFRKPGASWFIARLAVSMAVELGLHRSTKKWHAPDRKIDYIEEEMRKRVWWCLYAIDVNLCAKLGRPIGVTGDDYDIELPERIDDEYLTAEGFLPRPEGVEGCMFDVGIEMFKVIPLYIEINTSLYAVARPNRDKYVELVEQLEKRLMQWRNQVPKWISHDSPRIDHQYHALSLDLWYHEARVLMRHPSLSLSPSPIFNKSSVKICVDSSREILHLTDKIRGENSYMDATWYTITVQLLAALTILFSMWKKGEQEVTQQEIDQVKKDMDLCQEIMSDIGALLGSPNSLSDIVRRLTQGTLEYLQQRGNQQTMNSKTNRPLQGPGSSVLSISSPSLYPLTSGISLGGYTIPSSSLQPPKLPTQLLSPIDSDRLNRMSSPSQQLYPPTSQALSPTPPQPQTQPQQSYVLDTLSIPTENSSYDATTYTTQQQQSHNHQPSYYPQHQPRQEPPLHLAHLSHPHHPHPHSHNHSSHSHPHHHSPHTSIFPWTYPGSDWQKYAEYVSDINSNPHATNLVQAGLAGLMNLSAADNMMNTAAVASANRTEEVGGEQAQVQVGVSSAGGSGGGGGGGGGGTSASGWGVIGVGIGGGYSIAGVDGGRSGSGNAGGQVEGGGN